MENLNIDQLFFNIRKAIRLVFEYQKRMQGTMFQIKSLLNLSPADKLAVNKLYSNHLETIRKEYGTFKIYSQTWAWDTILPMALEYYLGEKKIDDHKFCLSVIQITDTGIFIAMKNGENPSFTDTSTYASAENSETMVMFVMEIRKPRTSWAKRWNLSYMRENYMKWLLDDRIEIDDKTREGNYFIIMKFKMADFVSENKIESSLKSVAHHIYSLTGLQIL